MSSTSTTPFCRNHRTTTAAVVALAALALLAGCSKREPAGGASKPGAPGGGAASGHGAVGTVAPPYELADLEGKTVRSSDFAGKVVILDFWATWCPPCRMEIPHFVSLQSKYREQGLVIVGLSLDAGGAKDVRPFAEEHDINYPLLIASEETANTYGGIVGIPTTFVIDRSGKIVQRFVGYTAPETFEEVIRPLLGAEG